MQGMDGESEKKRGLRALRRLPGVGKVIAEDLWNLGLHGVEELAGRDADELYEAHNRYRGAVQDRCMLYVFRCAVYYARTPAEQREPEKLLWWSWKD